MSVDDTPAKPTPARATPARATPRRGTQKLATPAPPASAQSRVHGTTARKLRVRTETAHRNWLMDTYKLTSQRARCLVTCWQEFGFLEEGRFLDWVRAGGMFEDGDVEEPDEEDGEDGRD